jgi:hypothetical protein
MQRILSLPSWALNGSKLPSPGRIDPVHKISSLAELGLSDGEGWDVRDLDVQNTCKLDTNVIQPTLG